MIFFTPPNIQIIISQKCRLPKIIFTSFIKLCFYGKRNLLCIRKREGKHRMSKEIFWTKWRDDEINSCYFFYIKCISNPAFLLFIIFTCSMKISQMMKGIVCSAMNNVAVFIVSYLKHPSRYRDVRLYCK